MGDRECIGDAWMAYLQREKNPFIVCLRENQHVLRAGYVALPISVIAQHLKVGDKIIVKVSCQLSGANETLSAAVRLGRPAPPFKRAISSRRAATVRCSSAILE